MIDNNLYIANVISIDDENDGGRIKAKILNTDLYKTEEEIPYAFPLLPKHFQVKPKVNEAVLIFLADKSKPNGMRFYIGPIISQPQFMYKDTYELGATTMLPGANKRPSPAMSNDANCNGVLPKDDEVAILGRKNSDIILGNDDLRIRCGVKTVNDSNKQDISFNKENPSFIKLKFHNKIISGIDNSVSSASIVADEINLIANCGEPYFDVYNADEQITDEKMREIVEKAHVLPYGDKLVEFLVLFLQMFKSHTHKYANLPPCPDKDSEKLEMAFGSTGGIHVDENYEIVGNVAGIAEKEIVTKTFNGLADKLLSKHIRIT